MLLPRMFRLLAMVSLVMVSLVMSIPSSGYQDEKTFLQSNGFGNLVIKFQEEELEIGQIARLDDPTLQLLGVSTIGGRFRIRDASQAWIDRLLQGQVVVENKEEIIVEAQEHEQEVGGGNTAEVDENPGQDQNEGEELEENRTDAEVEENRSDAEVEDPSELLFQETRSKTGKVFHDFFHNFYKYGRKMVKINGRAYFKCSYPKCQASL